MTTWKKEIAADPQVETFTVGNDRDFDLRLASFDVLGSMAHAKMLSECGLITQEEQQQLHEALNGILASIENGSFRIVAPAEDVHSQVELLLTEKLGATGKKIHTARSRNDQSLLDIKLFIRDQLQQTTTQITQLFERLQELSAAYANTLLPGYTHLQLAMPSSFGLWFGAFAESLSDDIELLLAAYRMADKNPLGSAAGYGSSFPINRERTTELLGFSAMNVNSVYAQLTRGKTEKAAAAAIAAVGSSLAKLAMDATLFMNQHFDFISFPTELTTGSSIMPHKKNPDVWELIRAKCNRLQSVPNELGLLLGNLPSGYHRDLQLTKEILFPAFETLHSCMTMTLRMLEQIQVREQILEGETYDPLFTVDAVNALVQQGVPFRDAYKQVGLAVEAGMFRRPAALAHTHTGSIGNPGNELVKKLFEERKAAFGFEKATAALEKLRQQ